MARLVPGGVSQVKRRSAVM